MTQTDGFSVVGGTVKLGRNQTLTSGGNFTVWGDGSFETGSKSTVIFAMPAGDVPGTGTITAPGVTFQNVTVDYANNTFSVKSSPTVAGTLTLESFGATAGNINVSGHVVTRAEWNDAASTGKITFVEGRGQRLTCDGGDGALPNIVVNKDSGGRLTITGDISPRNWTHVDGEVSARNSTTTFRRGSTVDTGDSSLGNVTIAMGEGTLQVDQLNVGGTLSIESAKEIKWVSGATTRKINVSGDLVSTDSDVGGNAVITMTSGASASLIGGAVGDFPDGGIVIDKGGQNVAVDVQRPLDGPLHLKSLGSLTGKLEVTNNVRTSSEALYGNSDFKRVLFFKGGAHQTLSADFPNASIPGVMIDKSGGSLTIGSRSADGVTYSTIIVTGDWIVTDNNKATFDVGSGADGSTIKFGINGVPMSPTIDTGRARTEGASKAVKGMRFNNVHNVHGVVTIEKMVVDGTLTLGSGSKINGGNIDAYGDVVVRATGGMTGNSRIRFLGTNDQRLSASGSNRRMPGVIINKTGGLLTIGKRVNDDPAHAIVVTGGWDHISGDVDATSQKSTIKFVGGTRSITPGPVVYYNVDFSLGKGQHMNFLPIDPVTGDPGTHIHEGVIKGRDKVKNGLFDPRPQP